MNGLRGEFAFIAGHHDGDLDLGGGDHLDVDALVGQGGEHGLGHARVAAHAHPDDRDLGHVLVDGDVLEADLGLGGADDLDEDDPARRRDLETERLKNDSTTRQGGYTRLASVFAPPSLSDRNGRTTWW